MQRFAGWVIALTGVLLVGQGIVGTIRRPRRAAPPIVVEWDYDDWFDLDYVGEPGMPEVEPDPDVPFEEEEEEPD